MIKIWLVIITFALSPFLIGIWVTTSVVNSLYHYKVFVATVYGESSGAKYKQQKAVASTIINRYKDKTNFNYKSISSAIYDAYDAAKFNTDLFRGANKYLHTNYRKYKDKELDKLYHKLWVVYYLGFTNTKATFFYSPILQKKFHKKYPKKYKAIPEWVHSKYLKKDQKVSNNQFHFYKITRRHT
jgi:spore germination cell wall hydrolase CwlJ-like protein